jgi:hypothetical protein
MECRLSVTSWVILELVRARALVPACVRGPGAVSTGDDRRAAAPVPAWNRRAEDHLVGAWAESAAATAVLLPPHSSQNRSVPATRPGDRSARLPTEPLRTRTMRRSPPRCRSEAQRAGPRRTAPRTHQTRRGETQSASSKRNAPRRSRNRLQTARRDERPRVSGPRVGRAGLPGPGCIGSCRRGGRRSRSCSGDQTDEWRLVSELPVSLDPQVGRVGLARDLGS